MVSSFHVIQPTVCQRVVQTVIGCAVCVHTPRLLFHLPSASSLPATCAFLHIWCEICKVLHSCRNEYGRRSQTAPSGPSISHREGKDDLSLCVYFGKAPERMLEQLFFPCWQIRPRDIPVCHSSDAPFAQAGARLDQSTVLIRVIEILRKE